MKKIKIGVVGTVRGITFIKLAQAFGDDVCLHAICETDAKRAEAMMKEIPTGARIFDDYDEFLRSGINAVILCNFFHEHTAYAIKALDRGIHVMSDTTAAPTLGECVALCRAAERSTAKYMLGANGPYKKCWQFIKKAIENGKLGTPFYAEAEYFHWSPGGKPYVDDNMHWRRLMPGTYYNMHTLGSLMYATNTMPKRVTASVIRVPGRAEAQNKLTDHEGAKVLCEMDNGAMFDTTGCCCFGPTSKWFRIFGEKGVIETKRYDETEVHFVSSDKHFYPDEPIPEIEVCKPKYEELDMAPKEEFESYTEEHYLLGHGGIDLWLFRNFIYYIKGEHEPFFNVYRAVALSAAAILGWRSVLNGGLAYDIPDFTKEEDRLKYENDFLSPFANENDPNLISRKARN